MKSTTQTYWVASANLVLFVFNTCMHPNNPIHLNMLPKCAHIRFLENTGLMTCVQEEQNQALARYAPNICNYAMLHCSWNWSIMLKVMSNYAQITFVEIYNTEGGAMSGQLLSPSCSRQVTKERQMAGNCIARGFQGLQFSPFSWISFKLRKFYLCNFSFSHAQ